MKLLVGSKEIEVTQQEIIDLHTGKLKIEDLEKLGETYTFYDDLLAEKDVIVRVKPMTVNRAWQGRRFKSPEYKMYEKQVIGLLPSLSLPEPPYRLQIVFGLSSSLNDIDNGVKPFVDILQKKYKFNDKMIYGLVVDKVKVKKGEEFIKFSLTHYDNLHAPR